MKLKNKQNIIRKSLIFLSILLFLNSCSETIFLVNSAKRLGTWGEKPKYKIGNPYRINGKWYYPAVDYDYDETGVASWYGPKFHGKKTANGETFDQNKISAAHKTLPLPSFVRITNLENGKVLPKVRINDRGPFARKRIIDLSKKAAEVLGFANKGTANVRVQILENESRDIAMMASVHNGIKAKPAKIKKIKKKKIKDKFAGVDKLTHNNSKKKIQIDFPENAKKEITDDKEQKKTEKYESFDNLTLSDNDLMELQIAAFKDHRNAKTLLRKLEDFSAYIKREFTDDKYLYKVRIGPIKNIQIAREIKEKLTQLGFTGINLIIN